MTVVSEVAEQEARAGSRPRWRLWIAIAVVAVLALSGWVGVRGRWVTVDRFSSGTMRATDRSEGTESGGGEGPFTVTGREARLTWRLNPGVERILVTVTPVGANSPIEFDKSLRNGELFRAGASRATDVGGMEFSTPDRTGSWSLTSLPAGEYWVHYAWSTIAGQKGRWTYRIEERLPWWEQPEQ